MNCREIFRYLFSEEAEQYFPDGCSHSEVFFLRTEGRKTYAFLLCQPEGEPGTEKARIYARPHVPGAGAGRRLSGALPAGLWRTVCGSGGGRGPLAGGDRPLNTSFPI